MRSARLKRMFVVTQSISLITLCSCGSNTQTSKAVLASYNNDPNSPVVALASHPDGGLLVSLGRKDAAGKVIAITGGMYIDEDDRCTTVAFGPDGRPARYDIHGHTTVDVLEYGDERVRVRVTDDEGSREAFIPRVNAQPFLDNLAPHAVQSAQHDQGYCADVSWQTITASDGSGACDLINIGGGFLAVLNNSSELISIYEDDRVIRGSYVNPSGDVYIDDERIGRIEFSLSGDAIPFLSPWLVTDNGGVMEYEEFTGTFRGTGLRPNQFAGAQCSTCVYWDRCVQTCVEIGQGPFVKTASRMQGNCHGDPCGGPVTTDSELGVIPSELLVDWTALGLRTAADGLGMLSCINCGSTVGGNLAGALTCVSCGAWATERFVDMYNAFSPQTRLDPFPYQALGTASSLASVYTNPNAWSDYASLSLTATSAAYGIAQQWNTLASTPTYSPVDPFTSSFFSTSIANQYYGSQSIYDASNPFNVWNTLPVLGADPTFFPGGWGGGLPYGSAANPWIPF